MIAAPGATLAAAGAGLAAVLGFAAFGGQGVTALAVALAQAVLLVGWARAVPVPDPLLGVGLAALAGAAADVLVLAYDGSHPLEPVALMLGPVVVLAFLAQLVRRAPRPGVTSSLTSTLLLVTVTVLASLHVAARGTRGGAPLVAAVAAGAVVAALLGPVPVPQPLHRLLSRGRTESGRPGSRAQAPGEALARVLLSGVLGAGAGALVGVAASDLGAVAGTWLGATAGVVAAVGRVLALDATAPPPEAVLGGSAATADPGLAVLVAAALPVALTGPVSYVLGRILVG